MRNQWHPSATGLRVFPLDTRATPYRPHGLCGFLSNSKPGYPVIWSKMPTIQFDLI